MSDWKNPGSREALDAGCRCPVMDNNHGKRPGMFGGWYIALDCPVHGDGERTNDDA